MAKSIPRAFQGPCRAMPCSWVSITPCSLQWLELLFTLHAISAVPLPSGAWSEQRVGGGGLRDPPEVTNLCLHRGHTGSSTLLAPPELLSCCRRVLQGFVEASSGAFSCSWLCSSLNSLWSKSQRAPKASESLGLFGISVLPTERNNESFLS